VSLGLICAQGNAGTLEALNAGTYTFSSNETVARKTTAFQGRLPPPARNSGA